MACAERGNQLKLQWMQQAAARGGGEDEQPVVASGGRRPLELPRFGIAEEIKLAQSRVARVVDREPGEQLERGTLREFRVVAGLQQKQTVVINGGDRGRYPAAVDRKEQQPQPGTLASAFHQQRVEPLHRRIRRDRRAFTTFPARFLQPLDVIAARGNRGRVGAHLEARQANLRKTIEAVSHVLAELRADRGGQPQIRGGAALPDARCVPVASRQFSHDVAARESPGSWLQLKHIPPPAAFLNRAPDRAYVSSRRSHTITSALGV
jgi:hypothetical protein